jgi:DNA-binding MarR family transcriptional regulator
MNDDRRQALQAEVEAALHAYHRAVDRLDDAIAARLGINRTDLRCMELLLFAGPLSAGRLADGIGLSKTAITTVVDRLERAGYVRRTTDAADRRRILVEATESARDLADQLYGPLGAAGHALLSRYTEAELMLIRDHLRAGQQLNEAHLERVRTGETSP